MAQLDDIVGSVMQKLEAIGEEDNTILVFTTDNVLCREFLAA
jgi:arylsulfatase